MKKNSVVRSRGRTDAGNGVTAPATIASPESPELPTNTEAGVGDLAPPSQQEIEFQAYQIWVSEGCPDGCALDHWSRAQSRLEAERRERFRQNLGAFC